MTRHARIAALTALAITAACGQSEHLLDRPAPAPAHKLGGLAPRLAAQGRGALAEQPTARYVAERNFLVVEVDAAAVDKYDVASGISYISTGGGAFLEFLEGKTLPAVAALAARGDTGGPT